jgi:hypothetical protein
LQEPKEAQHARDTRLGTIGRPTPCAAMETMSGEGAGYGISMTGVYTSSARSKQNTRRKHPDHPPLHATIPIRTTSSRNAIHTAWESIVDAPTTIRTCHPTLHFASPNRSLDLILTELRDCKYPVIINFLQCLSGWIMHVLLTRIDISIRSACI